MAKVAKKKAVKNAEKAPRAKARSASNSSTAPTKKAAGRKTAKKAAKAKQPVVKTAKPAKKAGAKTKPATTKKQAVTAKRTKPKTASTPVKKAVKKAPAKKRAAASKTAKKQSTKRTAPSKKAAPVKTPAKKAVGGKAPKLNVDQVIKEFRSVVNLKPDQLERWLSMPDSKKLGFKDEVKAGTRGHESGKRILKILSKRRDKYTEDDLRHMETVVGFVRQHRRQKPPGDVFASNWRYSLMNWGHDPMK